LNGKPEAIQTAFAEIKTQAMSGRDFLGEFEHIIALANLRLEAQAYGVTVRQEIEFRTNRDVSIGPVYAD
jgi:PadR family transcriptional regulator PadR